MRHEDAIRDKAIERYLLAEMTEDEQGIFEEHYFDCRVCAAEVTDGTRMMMAGRIVAAEEAQTSNVVPMPARRFQWVPAAAAASLIFGFLGSGVGYRLALQQHEPRTELVQPVWINTGVSRAGTPSVVDTVRPGDELRFDIEPHDEAERYAAVVNCGGKFQSRTDGISRKMAEGAVVLRLGELPSGRCELVIEGVRKDGNRFKITSSPFEVRVGER